MCCRICHSLDCSQGSLINSQLLVLVIVPGEGIRLIGLDYYTSASNTKCLILAARINREE